MYVHGKQQAGVPTLVAGVQTLCALCRTFLGPHKATKCVISPAAPTTHSNDAAAQQGDDGHTARPAHTADSVLVTSPSELLHAMDGEPTSTMLLLELLETQVSMCGSGSSWLLAVVGAMLSATLPLIQQQGVPLPAVLSGLNMAVSVCEQVAQSCTIDLPAIAAVLPAELLQQQWQDICSKLSNSTGSSVEVCADKGERQGPQKQQQQQQQPQHQSPRKEKCSWQQQFQLVQQGQQQQKQTQGDDSWPTQHWEGTSSPVDMEADTSDVDWFFEQEEQPASSNKGNAIVVHSQHQTLHQELSQSLEGCQQSGQHADGRSRVASSQHGEGCIPGTPGRKAQSSGRYITGITESKAHISKADESDVAWFFETEDADVEGQGGADTQGHATLGAGGHVDATSVLQQLQQFLEVASSAELASPSISDDDIARGADQDHVLSSMRLADQQQQLAEQGQLLGSQPEDSEREWSVRLQQECREHQQGAWKQPGQQLLQALQQDRQQSQAEWLRHQQQGQQVQQKFKQEQPDQHHARHPCKDHEHPSPATLTASQQLLAAAALTTAHGAAHETALAAAALAATAGICMQQPTGLSDAASASPTQLLIAHEEMSAQCQKLQYAKQVQVLELQGPAQHSSVVLPGACLNLNHLINIGSVESILSVLLGTSTDSTGTVTNSQQTGHCGSHSSPSSVVRVAFIDGGLGMLAPGVHGSAPDAKTVFHSEPPPWAALLQPNNSMTHVVTNLQDVLTVDEELQQAAEGVLGVLQALQVQLLLLQGHLPQRLHEYILQMQGIVLLGSIPGRTFSALSAACGKIPAAGLAGLAAQGQHAVAHVRVYCIERGRQDGHFEGAITRPVLQSLRHIQPEQLLVLHPEANVTHTAPAAQPTGCLPVRMPSVPSATVLLHAATQPGLQASATRLPGCFARLRACLSEGCLLPGAGMYELMCCHALEAAAGAHCTQVMAHCRTSAPGSSEENMQPWQQLNKVARETMRVGQSEAMKAVASSLQELVVMILQNQGTAYAQALEHVTAACHLLGESLMRTQAAAAHSLQYQYRLHLRVLKRLQACLQVDVDDRTCGDLLIGDGLQCRVHALRAAAGLVQQVLSTDLHLVNSTDKVFSS